MKTFKHYLTESVRSYKYTIKIAGSLDKKATDLFIYNLNKFDPVTIGDPVTTPIQKSPHGFPEESNQPVTIIKAEFRYPATEPMIQQVARLIGWSESSVRMTTTEFEEGLDTEGKAYENQADHSPLLTHPELEDSGKEANKAYGDSYLSSIKDQRGEPSMDIPYEGKKTPDSFDPFAKPVFDKAGINSPMSKSTRSAKPATGSSK